VKGPLDTCLLLNWNGPEVNRLGRKSCRSVFEGKSHHLQMVRIPSRPVVHKRMLLIASSSGIKGETDLGKRGWRADLIVRLAPFGGLKQ